MTDRLTARHREDELRQAITKLRTASRRAADVLYRMGAPSGAGTPAVPEMPDDVADAVALRVWLEDMGASDGSAKELRDYLRASLDRFRLTMALLPDLPRGARVLELGANPYFLTRLLQRRGIELTCANWFDAGSYGPLGSQTFTTSRTGERLSFEFDHFNAETDPFPYSDGRFRAVLCCGILELLPTNPTHLLAEIHRVLEPGGLLVLTTPNAARWDTIRRVEAGWPVDPKLSNHGVYGRANREYTIGEVTDFLRDLGYHLEEAFTADAAPAPQPPRLPPHANPLNRADTIFVRARAENRARWRYPNWLYDGPARWEVVQPDMAVGFNDDVQARGLHPLDVMAGGYVRWMGGDPYATVLVEARGGPSHLVVEGIAPPPRSCRLMKLTATLAGQTLSWRLEPDSSRFRVSGPVDLPGGPVEVRLACDRTWRPCEIGVSPDERALSVALRRVAVEPDAPPAVKPSG